jgi:hypothetical protein
MRYALSIRTAAVGAALAAGCALAQTPAPAVTDVGPPPAEERGSTGAVVLQNSLVRAQREDAFQKSSTQTGVGSVGRGVLRATMKAQAQADLAHAREAEAADLYNRGAGALTPK